MVVVPNNLGNLVPRGRHLPHLPSEETARAAAKVWEKSGNAGGASSATRGPYPGSDIAQSDITECDALAGEAPVRFSVQYVQRASFAWVGSAEVYALAQHLAETPLAALTSAAA